MEIFFAPMAIGVPTIAPPVKCRQATLGGWYRFAAPMARL
jgi:hypothetical protein